MVTNFANLLSEAVRGGLNRREFLGRAAALGITAASASALLAEAALAQGPKRGGTLRIGSVGGASTDSLDPASLQSQAPFIFSRCWGETLVQPHPTSGSPVGVLAESWRASNDLMLWTF